MSHFQVPPFLSGSSIYEVNLRQFTREGTIQAFIPHIDRIRDLGADILWFMPVHPIGVKNRKGSLGSYYSIRDYKDINPEFGTQHDFKELVDRVHQAGMKLVIDWVANHTAWDHPWTVEHPEYYTRDSAGQFMSPFDWTDAIQLDHQSEAQREAMVDAMEFWVREMDIDGFRTDMAHLIPLELWIRARKKTESIKPGLIWLAETEDPAYFQAFDILYAWKWMHFTERFVKERLPVSDMISFLRHTWEEMPPGGLQMYFTSNHDENTWNGTEFDKYDVYARALAIASFTLPQSVPMVYGGQEIPFTGRLPFFDKSEISWPAVRELDHFYRSLFYYRKKCLRNTPCIFLPAEDGILSFHRTESDHEEWVALNFSDRERPVSFADIHGRYHNILEDSVLDCSGTLTQNLMPGDGLILSRVK